MALAFQGSSLDNADDINMMFVRSGSIKVVRKWTSHYQLDGSRKQPDEWTIGLGFVVVALLRSNSVGSTPSMEGCKPRKAKGPKPFNGPAIVVFRSSTSRLTSISPSNLFRMPV
jgi:hypothetical protein